MKNIDVPMTEQQLKFVIGMIHVDNPFRHRLEKVLEESKKTHK